MEGFVREKEEFVGDVGFDWKPVKVDESGCDVLPGPGAGQDPGS